ncbi:MAG TPA: DUF2294 domain-containing protein [bacterium]|nr:DUF2294 domain-containing protein [bacterium]
MDTTSGRGRQVTEEVVHAMIRYLKERIGRGPEGYRTYVMDDMIILRLHNVLTPVEYAQAQSPESRKVIKDARTRLIEDLRPSLEEVFRQLTEANVVSMHSDLSTKTGESIIIFVLDRKLRDVSGGSGGVA